MHILTTGIHGFVGNNLVEALKKQHSIYGLDIISPQKDGIIKTYAWNELDQIPSVDVIIHLAGKAHDTKNNSEAQVYFDINTGLTQKIYDYFLTSSATKFIFFSSVKAAADTVHGDILTEDVIPNPKGPYGKSKIAAENYILSHKPQNRLPERVFPEREAVEGKLSKEAVSCDPSLISGPQSSDKKVYILRPCMIHGPGNKGNLNLLYKVVSKRIPWPLGAFENRRSFTSVDNLSFVIGQLVEKDIESGIYHMADDEPLSTNELIELISESLNRRPHIWPLAKGLLKALASSGDYLHLPLNSERLRKLTESYVVSNEKIKKALGIEKMPVTAKAGMKKTLESFRKS